MTWKTRDEIAADEIANESLLRAAAKAMLTTNLTFGQAITKFKEAFIDAAVERRTQGKKRRKGK